MSFGLDPQSYPVCPVDIESLISVIAGGKAVLFVGSGYSRNAIGLNGEALVTAAGLAGKIGELGGFDADDDLRYASEKYIRDNDPAALVEMLLDLFVVKDVLPHHVSIASAPWRRIYTTNYDTCLEDAAKKNGIRIHSVSLEDSPKNYLVGKRVCVHLNGLITGLTPKDLNNTFKLSESSYLSADSFVESNWHHPFKRDLEMCSALVFVGYSLYDIEIQKMLFENEDFRGKTFFFTAPNVSERERFKLAPFGVCVPIGAEGFARELDKSLSDFIQPAEKLPLCSIERYVASDKADLARDRDVERFLMYGDVLNSIIDTAVYTDDGAPILVRRRDLGYAVEALSAGRHVVVLADFGNGKTVFLRSLKAQLSHKGFVVYSVDNLDVYNREDLELLAKSNARSYLFVDSYDQHIDFLRHFADLSPSNLVLVLAARTGNHDRMRSQIESFGISLDEVSIDELSEVEVGQLVDIIDNVGLWGAQATLSMTEKVALVQHKNMAQFQQALLSIFQSPQMLSRVSELLKDLVSKNSKKRTVFSISLLSALDYPLNFGLISEVSGCNDIYSSDLRGMEGFRSLFRVEGSRIVSRSSVFSLALIKYHFEPVYVVAELLDIVARLEEHAASDSQVRDLTKTLLRFSSVERLFPEHQRINNLVRYYEKLKIALPWLKRDPHYWLQYGMALISYDSFSSAQRLLDQAYEFAAKRDNYHTVHIDTQQSRLFLKMSAAEVNAVESYRLFKRAMEFLAKVPNDFHKFRRVDEIYRVFGNRYGAFSVAHKAAFSADCAKLLGQLRSLLQSGFEQQSKVAELELARERLEIMVAVED